MLRTMHNLPRNNLSEVLSGQEVRIESWRDFQDQAAFFANNRGQWCFRGQRNAKWGLTPSLERTVIKGPIPTARVEKVFLSRFKRQAHHYLPTTPKEDSTIEWLALMQHWGVPTRLLDFTLSPYVGLFFAVVDMDAATDESALWAIHWASLDLIVGFDLDGETIRKIMPDWAQNEKHAPQLQLRSFFDAAYRKHKEFSFVAPVQPFMMNERLALQQGMFLCPFTLSLPFEVSFVQPPSFQHVIDAEAKQINSHFARKLVITKSARCEILRELHRMNITSASLFPGLGGFAQSLREFYEALTDVKPAERDSELSAIEDFGWSG